MAEKSKQLTLFGHFRSFKWLYLLFSFSFIMLLVSAAFIPPVWQLTSGPVEILRWPKSGPRYFKVGPGEENWTPLSDISKHAINAIIVAEDARYYEHFGLDLREIKSSIAFNMEKKRFARGASTITQQVVKMVFLDSEKNMMRKMREALGAILLEFLLDKDQILTWYMNLVEFGDGVFGIKAASQHFFQTDPELLTIQNATQLAMILPSPNGWGKSLKSRQLTEFGQRRFATIISEMQKQGLITPALKDAAMATGNFGKPVDGYQPSSLDYNDTDEQGLSTSDQENPTTLDTSLNQKQPDEYGIR